MELLKITNIYQHKIKKLISNNYIKEHEIQFKISCAFP